MLNTSTFNETKLNSMPNGAMKACLRHGKSIRRLREELLNPKRTLRLEKINSLIDAHATLLNHCSMALGATK